MRLRDKYPPGLVMGLARELDFLLQGRSTWNRKTAGDRENMCDFARGVLRFLAAQGVAVPVRSSQPGGDR